MFMNEFLIGLAFCCVLWFAVSAWQFNRWPVRSSMRRADRLRKSVAHNIPTDNWEYGQYDPPVRPLVFDYEPARPLYILSGIFWIAAFNSLSLNGPFLPVLIYGALGYLLLRYAFRRCLAWHYDILVYGPAAVARLREHSPRTASRAEAQLQEYLDALHEVTRPLTAEERAAYLETTARIEEEEEEERRSLKRYHEMIYPPTCELYGNKWG